LPGGGDFDVNWIDSESTDFTDAFETEQHWSLPRMTQIGAGILKMQAVKHSCFGFLAHPIHGHAMC